MNSGKVGREAGSEHVRVCLQAEFLHRSVESIWKRPVFYRNPISHLLKRKRPGSAWWLGPHLAEGHPAKTFTGARSQPPRVRFWVPGDARHSSQPGLTHTPPCTQPVQMDILAWSWPSPKGCQQILGVLEGRL